ncbi:hypothetical protein EW146_g6156 [Bondarzewia mesenterica]|uniref:Uncharacterized protein n=1 Tax=Bondarzewia mesenterica TaxID=1095465 RepID=A0A4S4LPF7_9AGAM|nr:hypothetical protein EW146_g6156 [Bondarzewia mesenterica]
MSNDFIHPMISLVTDLQLSGNNGASAHVNTKSPGIIIRFGVRSAGPARSNTSKRYAITFNASNATRGVGTFRTNGISRMVPDGDVPMWVKSIQPEPEPLRKSAVNPSREDLLFSLPSRAPAHLWWLATSRGHDCVEIQKMCVRAAARSQPVPGVAISASTAHAAQGGGGEFVATAGAMDMTFCHISNFIIVFEGPIHS